MTNIKRFAGQSTMSDETQWTVQHDAIRHGMVILEKLIALDFDSLILRVEKISQEYDKKDWYETAADLCIDVEALKALDACEPPVPYPYYFCTPDILLRHPELVAYYRNVAMVTQRAMDDMGLNTTAYEAEQVPPPDVARDLARRFNRIISTLVVVGPVTPQRHLEMAYVNLGAGFDGSWGEGSEE